MRGEFIDAHQADGLSINFHNRRPRRTDILVDLLAGLLRIPRAPSGNDVVAHRCLADVIRKRRIRFGGWSKGDTTVHLGASEASSICCGSGSRYACAGGCWRWDRVGRRR